MTILSQHEEVVESVIDDYNEVNNATDRPSWKRYCD
jgi:hypothetical protein